VYLIKNGSYKRRTSNVFIRAGLFVNLPARLAHDSHFDASAKALAVPSAVADLFAAAGLALADCVGWGQPVPERAPGVHVVALTDGADSIDAALATCPARPVGARDPARAIDAAHRQADEQENRSRRGLALMRSSLAPCDDPGVRCTVLIVDDHEDFRLAARALLEADGFVVVGEAADGGSAIAEGERLRPRLVLLDVQLPDRDGFEIAARLAEAAYAPTVVLTSSRAPSSYRRLGRGSLAFIPKAELSGEALAALVP
jgi:CheY-like chemotaxis protein